MKWFHERILGECKSLKNLEDLGRPAAGRGEQLYTVSADVGFWRREARAVLARRRHRRRQHHSRRSQHGAISYAAGERDTRLSAALRRNQQHTPGSAGVFFIGAFCAGTAECGTRSGRLYHGRGRTLHAQDYTPMALHWRTRWMHRHDADADWNAGGRLRAELSAQSSRDGDRIVHSGPDWLCWQSDSPHDAAARARRWPSARGCVVLCRSRVHGGGLAPGLAGAAVLDAAASGRCAASRAGRHQRIARAAAWQGAPPCHTRLVHRRCPHARAHGAGMWSVRRRGRATRALPAWPSAAATGMPVTSNLSCRHTLVTPPSRASARLAPSRAACSLTPSVRLGSRRGR